ncbi:hypothetical protein BKA70DRAFT_1491427, partial [Coprinopsis sp. MPI-PUGE-AT-0042]
DIFKQYDDTQKVLIHLASLFNSLLTVFQVYLSCVAFSRFQQLSLEKKRKRKRYIYFLILTLILSSTRCVLYLRDGTWTLDSSGVHNTLRITKIPIHELAISFGSTGSLWLVGDAFLVWRASIICNHNRILRRAPLVAYAISFAVCIASFLSKLRALCHMRDAPGGAADLRRAHISYQSWRIADFSMSVVVSIVTTTMIGARLVLMQRKMERLSEQTGGTFRSTLPYQQIFALILESALPFTLVGVVTAICAGTIDVRNNTYRWSVHAFPFLMVLWTNALSLGPQLIIFRVISETTWTSNLTADLTRPVSQPIFFEDDPVVSLLTAYTDHDHEVDNQELFGPYNESGGQMPGVRLENLVSI